MNKWEGLGGSVATYGPYSMTKMVTLTGHAWYPQSFWVAKDVNYIQFFRSLDMEEVKTMIEVTALHEQ